MKFSLGQSIGLIWKSKFLDKNGQNCRCMRPYYEMNGHAELTTLKKYFSPDD